MAAPMAGEANLPLQTSDLHFISNMHRSIYDPAEDDLPISHLARSKTSHPYTPPPPPPPPTLVSSMGKRRKSKPVRYGVSTTVVETIHSLSKPNTLVHDPSSNCLSSQKENPTTNCSNSSVESSPAMIQAEKLQSSLGMKDLSCIKLIVKTNLGFGSMMVFPQPFSKLFLPKVDHDMVIEDEHGQIHHLRYNAHKIGLDAGWEVFALGHNLHEGDVLVFCLVQFYKFKVYIIRANDRNKVDSAISLWKLEAHTKQTIPVQKKQWLPTIPSNSGNDSEEVMSEILEGSRPSFQEFKTFQDFHIMVKGQCIDSELPEDVRINYYKLCISKKELLHDCLPEGLYYKLVAGMIGETVNIAKEIKNCKLTTTKEELEAWDNSLKSFEILGMNIGFLRDRIRRLEWVVLESEVRFDVQRYNEAKNEEKRIEDEIKCVVEKLVGLKESYGKIEGMVGGLKEKLGRHELRFQEEVVAPW